MGRVNWAIPDVCITEIFFHPVCWKKKSVGIQASRNIVFNLTKTGNTRREMNQSEKDYNTGEREQLRTANYLIFVMTNVGISRFIALLAYQQLLKAMMDHYQSAMTMKIAFTMTKYRWDSFYIIA